MANPSGASTRRLSFPIKARTVVTSGFGYRYHPVYGENRFHSGIDLSAAYGTPVHAAGPGQVIYANWYGGYGYTVIILHPRPSKTLYAHLSQIYVRNGQYVSTDSVIGRLGSTGISTGPHLHLEYWLKINGQWRVENPANHLAW